MRGFHERGYFFHVRERGGSGNFGGTGRVRVRVPGPIFVFGVRRVRKGREIVGRVLEEY